MFHTFSKGITPKENVIMQREFKLAYYDVSVQHFSHNITGTHHKTNLQVSIPFFFSITISIPYFIPMTSLAHVKSVH